MCEIKQRIIQASVDGNIWLVGQLVDELEAKHEEELRKASEVNLEYIQRLFFEANTLLDAYKKLGSTEVQKTICMEGENQFKNVNYKPCCKHGYDDCIYDPAYIYATYPEWYKKLYGNRLPEEVTCAHCENGERWDDEDK
jgi:hypothetical protein